MSEIIIYPTKSNNKKGKLVAYIQDEICCYKDPDLPIHSGYWKSIPKYIGGLDDYKESEDSKGSLGIKDGKIIKNEI